MRLEARRSPDRLDCLVRVVLAPVVLVAATSACHPPASAALTDAQADAHNDAATITVDRKAYPRILNPAGPDSTLFFAGSGEGCHKAKVPHPEQIPDLGSAEAVPCPDILRDPAWNRCVGGSLFSSSDQKKCLCVTGDPAPRALEVPCPEPVK